jgi:hypothetical protein
MKLKTFSATIMAGLFLVGLSWWFYHQISEAKQSQPDSTAQAGIQISAQPTVIAINQDHTVSIEARVPTLKNGKPLLPESVVLLRYDNNGRLLGNNQKMAMDYASQDATLGDSVFSTRVELSESLPTTIQFRISAAYRGELLRVLSDSVTVTAQ